MINKKYRCTSHTCTTLHEQLTRNESDNQLRMHNSNLGGTSRILMSAHKT